MNPWFGRVLAESPNGFQIFSRAVETLMNFSLHKHRVRNYHRLRELKQNPQQRGSEVNRKK
jgi:hypothetical protein